MSCVRARAHESPGKRLIHTHHTHSRKITTEDARDLINWLKKGPGSSTTWNPIDLGM